MGMKWLSALAAKVRRPERPYVVDPTPWPCILVRTRHEPHTWWPSTEMQARCPGWPRSKGST